MVPKTQIPWNILQSEQIMSKYVTAAIGYKIWVNCSESSWRWLYGQMGYHYGASGGITLESHYAHNGLIISIPITEPVLCATRLLVISVPTVHFTGFQTQPWYLWTEEINENCSWWMIVIHERPQKISFFLYELVFKNVFNELILQNITG
jgi:hypothetical protein